jgi:hypothetical protein
LKHYPFKDQPAPNRIFNYRLRGARGIGENAFGIDAYRFRVLRKPMDLCPLTADNIVLTICVLHNFLFRGRESRSSYLYAGSAATGTRDDGEGLSVNYYLLPLQRGARNDFNSFQKGVTEELKEFLVAPQGEISWQYNHIIRSSSN